MNLVKWLRKNNRKVMTVVVVFIMIAFVLGGALTQWARSMGRSDSVIYNFGGDGEIKQSDQAYADIELNILSALNLGESLLARNPQNGQIGQRNLGELLLYQLLFSQSGNSAQISQICKALSGQSQSGISESQIDEFFTQSGGDPLVTWLLLKNEAKQMGVTVLTEPIKDAIAQGQNVNRVNALSKNLGIDIDKIAQTIAEFETVRSYVSLMTSGESTTLNEVQNLVSFQAETIGAEFVEVFADAFEKDVAEPADAEIAAQFDKYKNTIVNMVSDDNPFGFGYKLPDRVRLEYVLVDINDVDAQIGAISDQEAEDFYQQNISQMVEQVRSNPADPNSEIIQRTVPYAKVAKLIKMRLRNGNIAGRAEEIINFVKDETDKNYGNIEWATADVNELRDKAVSYDSAAAKAVKEFGIEIEAGTTSLISAIEMMQGSKLGDMAVGGGTKSAVSLAKLVFSVKELGDAVLPFDVSRPVIYKNIGMLRDRFGKSVGLVRIVEVAPAGSPESLTDIKAKMPMRDESEYENLSMREQVIADIKHAAAMDVAEVKAKEFMAAVGDDWEKSATEFNAKLGVDVNETQAYVLGEWEGQARLSLMSLAVVRETAKGQPGNEMFGAYSAASKRFFDDLAARIDGGTLEAKGVPFVKRFELRESCFVFKKLVLNKINDDDYSRARIEMGFMQDARNMQRGALALLLPENVRERMGLRLSEDALKRQAEYDAKKAEEEAKKAKG
jgi:hypothetical protein